MSEPRYTKAKSVSQKKLKVETSLRLVNFNVVIIEGFGMFHSALHWPKGGNAADLIDGVKNFILKYLHSVDASLIFDRYYNYSTMSKTRAGRVTSFTCDHNLFRQSPLPSKYGTLSCTESKVQLIEKIFASLADIDLEKNRLVITSNDHCPTELKMERKNFVPTWVRVIKKLTTS